MREVGAQQLICVSALGYPESIVDEVATRYGPTVKLMTLKELREARVEQLIFAVPYAIHTHPHISFESVGPVELESAPHDVKELKLNPHDKVFSLSNPDERFSLVEVVDKLYKSYVPELFVRQGVFLEPSSYSLDVALESSKRDLWLHLGRSRFKVRKLPIRLLVETRMTDIPLSVYSYRQEVIDDTVAWIISAKGFAEGEEVGFQIVFRPNERGFLQLASVRHEGTSSVELLISPDESVVRKAIGRHDSL